jgi:hypothetical protein
VGVGDEAGVEEAGADEAGSEARYCCKSRATVAWLVPIAPKSPVL